MNNFQGDGSRLFEAFIKSVQLSAGLRSRQDVQDSLGKFITGHLPAEWIAFAERDPVNGVTVPHYTLSDGDALRFLLTDEVRAVVEDVLESGFLTSAVIFRPDPSMTAFLPVSEESQQNEVLLVGHGSAEPVPNELLNIYLAIAGLAGATFERLSYEQELDQHRTRLEELVKERTAELQAEIGERMAAQAALYEERERLSVTLESIGDGVIATDMDANIVLLNGVAQKLTGWSKEDAEGKPLLEVFNIINEKTGERQEDPVLKALATGVIVGLANHTALIARDGSRRSIADSCAPIRSGDGAIIGAVLVFRDVTEETVAAQLRDSLNEINASINSTLEFDQIMQAVVVEAAEAIGCDASSVEMREDGYWELRYLYGLPQEMIGSRLGFDVAHGLEKTFRTGEPFLIEGDDVGRILEDVVIKAFQIRSMMLMPIIVRGQVVAALRFVDQNSSMAFRDIQVDFARKLAASLSLALENARLYAAERHIAETLQEALLITPQELPGIKFGHLYRSATEAARVGGDFYDIFEIDEGKIGIVIGDVAGKGVSAASLTVVVENTIKAFAHQGYPPAEVLERANPVISRATHDSSFVTVFFGILDTKTGHLDYCNGGHPPALLMRDGGRLEHLRTASPVVGAFDGVSFDGDRTQLAAGDMLVLYTDGTVEARSTDGSFFGAGRLADALAAPGAVDQMPRQIFDMVMAFTGGILNDDMAILTVSLKS